MISIIIPTYNEKENIEKLVPIISKNLEGYDYEMIVVDDNSPDGTAKVAEELSIEYPVVVLKRNERGLASAVLHGFKHSKGEILGVIDADLQHPPEYIREMVYIINSGYDIVIGSRYIKGGRIEGWSKVRIVVSKGAILLSRPLISIKDPMSGYFFLKRKVIENISFNPIGYKILLEILIKGSYANIKEIPYDFKVRNNGRSKLTNKEYINYIKLLYHLYEFKMREILE